MKKIKGIISFILTAALIFGCTSVFASADYADKIMTVWGDEYFYSGNLTEGENDTTVKSDGAADYFVFDAETEGYYVVSFNEAGPVYSLCELEKAYSSSYEENWGVIGDGNKEVFYFDSGENYIGAWSDKSEGKSVKIDIEYAGKEITDITFAAGTDYPLIYGSDIVDEEYYISLIYIHGFALTFDSENTVDFSDAGEYFDYYTENSIEFGENEIEIEVEGKRFSKTVNVADINDYIEKIEIAGGEVTESVYYDGCSEGVGSFEFKLTYTDGTVVTVENYDEIGLGNGAPYKYQLFCDLYEGEGVVFIGTNELLYFTYDSKEVTFAENLRHFFSNIGYEFGYISRIPKMAEELLGHDSAADTLRAFGEFVSFVNNNFFYAIGDIFEHLVMLFETVS